jgi:hypothetical protein
MGPDDLLCSRNARPRTPSLGLIARPGKSIAKQSEGRAGEIYLPLGGRVKTMRAVQGSLDSLSQGAVNTEGEKRLPNHFLALSI